MKVLDFRSDTITQPTQAMRQAMYDAEVGDDILGEDPTVRRLEQMSAELCGKEAAMFVVSGTMGNQIAMMTLCYPGDEVLVGAESHLYNLEVGGLTCLAFAQARPLNAVKGRFAANEVRAAIRPKGVQSPISRVLCLENTYDLNRSIPLDAAYQQEMAGIAHAHNMTLYVDGARIFNAAVALKTTVKELCASVDCLQFCLCKGLCAPFGAMLVGSAEFIERARWVKQRIGGGFRQAGHMAAAGIVALETMQTRLQEDHDHAELLMRGLSQLNPGLVRCDIPHTNIVQVDFAAVGRTASDMESVLRQNNILVKPITPTAVRMSMRHGLERRDVEYALQIYKQILG